MGQNIVGNTNILGVIGHPIEHTMSPKIHNLLINELNHNNIYVPFHVYPCNLCNAIKGLKALGIKGINVTIPHKEEVIQYIDNVDEVAVKVGAVNTIKVTDEGLYGYNTDVYGLTMSLTNNGINIKDKNVIILGAGGAAKSAAVMCAQQGVKKIYIVNRNIERAEKLAESMKLIDYDNIEVMNYQEILKVKDADICIQTTSVGMYPNIDDIIIEDSSFYSGLEAAVDIIYNPKVTRFLDMALKAGAVAINGFDMLYYQAIKAYEIWDGNDIPKHIVERVYNKLLEEVLEDGK